MPSESTTPPPEPNAQSQVPAGLPTLTDIIESALLKGATRPVINLELARAAKANGLPGPTDDEINAAYAEILDRWVEDGNQPEEKSYAYHVRMRKHLYQKSFALNDFKTCLAVAADLAAVEERHRLHLAKEEKAKRLRLLSGANNGTGKETKTSGTQADRREPGTPAAEL
jgi:hypothetical protein